MMKSETHSFVLLLALSIGIRAVIFGILLVYTHPTDGWQFAEDLGLTLLVAVAPALMLLSRRGFNERP